MKSKTEKALFTLLDRMEIIDCHEHLPPENVRTSLNADVFTLFSHYTKGDLLRAGMTETDYDSLYNHDIPVDMRWKTFFPFWKDIKHTSFSKASLVSLKKFYGFDDVTDKNYVSISEKIKEFNKVGIYRTVLKDTCKIRTCLTQCGTTDTGTSLLTPVMPLLHNLRTKEELLHPCFETEFEIKYLDDYLSAMEKYAVKMKQAGAAGLKMFSFPYAETGKEEAESCFNKILAGKITCPEDTDSIISLRSYIADRAIEFAGRQNLVVAVHAGYWDDFRNLHPLHMIPLLIKHKNVRFDIYHLGYPWIRETLMLAKGFSNVWLNLCWIHIISQKAAMDGLDEAIDLVPVNKILAFGGDYRTPVEKIYGHLVMAKENISRVLAARIENGVLKEEQAEYMIKKWFWDNPVELYALDL